MSDSDTIPSRNGIAANADRLITKIFHLLRYDCAKDRIIWRLHRIFLKYLGEFLIFTVIFHN
jgi:hypothetical protein